jgi:tetratricopeptide (TPR) repeat protein
MSTPLLILLIGFVYVVFFGGLSLLRREGLSFRFAVEAVILTVAVSAFTYVSGYPIHPVLFLLALYMITMRVRLLVDLGNTLARRARYPLAEKIYTLALNLFPDVSSRLIVELNQGAVLIKKGELDAAIAAFERILRQSDEGYLGLKNETACHYNMAVAYQRQQNKSKALNEYRQILEIWPASEYGRRATAILERERNKSDPSKPV